MRFPSITSLDNSYFNMSFKMVESSLNRMNSFTPYKGLCSLIKAKTSTATKNFIVDDYLPKGKLYAQYINEKNFKLNVDYSELDKVEPESVTATTNSDIDSSKADTVTDTYIHNSDMCIDFYNHSGMDLELMVLFGSYLTRMLRMAYTDRGARLWKIVKSTLDYVYASCLGFLVATLRGTAWNGLGALFLIVFLLYMLFRVYSYNEDKKMSSRLLGMLRSLDVDRQGKTFISIMALHIHFESLINKENIIVKMVLFIIPLMLL